MRCPFKIGDWIRFDDDEGYVTFIGKEYLTCCVREWKDDNLLLLKTEMDAGHSGQSGRDGSIEDTSVDYAFILKITNKLIY